MRGEREHTTEEHPVRLGKVGDLISTAERELALRRLGSIPFHTVGGGDLAEHRVVIEDSSVWDIAELAVVSSCTEVELADGFGEGLQFRGRG